MTHQPVVGLDTINLRNLLTTYQYLDQGYMSKQGQHHYCRWGCGHAFVPWELLVMGEEGETDLSLDHAGDHQAQHG
jgi:hypothetical protein